MTETDSWSHIGTNIRAIRRRRHLSQAELAVRLGMRPGPVNCIENGRNLPSARVLQKLADVLAVPIDAFFHPTVSVPDGPSALCEGAAPYLAAPGAVGAMGPRVVPARTREESLALSAPLTDAVSTLADAFLALEDLCGAVKSAELPLNIRFDRTEEGLQTLCGRVRGLLGVSDAVIFDYLELFENAGLRVIFAPLPDDAESLSCHDVENGNAFFFIACGRTTPERQLFRLCYELGRLYIHAPERYGFTGGRVGVDSRRKPFTEDRAARRFAGLFLMPEAAVRATVRQLGVKPGGWSLDLLYRIKHRFGVSAEALLYRLRELRLIAQARHDEFKAAIARHYREYDKAEPDSTRRVLSPNGRLGDLLLTAGERGGRRADEAAAIGRRLAEMELPGMCKANAENPKR